MIGIGIVGLGKSGLDIHVPCIEATPGLELVAGCDPTSARRELAVQRIGNIKTYSSLEALLGDRRVDLVVITTPTASHEAIALQVLQAGKHLLIDKPMALDLPGTDRIVQAAEAAGVVLSMFQNRRWEPGFLCIQKLLTEGAIGKVLGIESRRMCINSTLAYPAQEFRPTWRQEKAYGVPGLEMGQQGQDSPRIDRIGEQSQLNNGAPRPPFSQHKQGQEHETGYRAADYQ